MLNLLKNFTYSFGINAINAIFPILLIPFFIKTLGIEVYAVLAIVFRLSNVATTVTDWSYNITGPLEVEKNKQALSAYISRAFATKLVLCFAVLFVFLSIAGLLFSAADFFVIGASFTVLALGRSLNTHWVFIGLDKLKDFFWLFLVSKSIAIGMLFWLLPQYPSIALICLLIGGNELIFYLITFKWLAVKQQARIVIKPSLNNFKVDMIQGRKIFVTNLFIGLLMNMNVIFLAIFNRYGLVSLKTIGVYDIAEKIITLAKHFANIINQSVYPKLVKLSQVGKKQFNAFARHHMLFNAVVFTLGAMVILVFSTYMVSFFTTTHRQEAALYLRIMAFIPLIHAIAQPTHLSLVFYGYKDYYYKAYFYSVVLGVSCILILVWSFKIYGILVSNYVAGIAVAIFLTYYLARHDRDCYLNKIFGNHG